MNTIRGLYKVGNLVRKLYMAFSKFGLFRWDTIWGLFQVREMSRANVTGEYPSRQFLNLFLTSDIVWVYLLISLWYCNY